MVSLRRKSWKDREESEKRCYVCKNVQPRIDVWKLLDGKYICRVCKKEQGKNKTEKNRSNLRDFKKRPDYVPDDFNKNIKSRLSDQEFEQLIEEFEQGGWSETRSIEETKKHEAYINFLFKVEFQRRRGTNYERKEHRIEKSLPKSRTTYYQILEVKQIASFAEIRDSYKKLVIKWHPDKNKDDPILAESMFKKIHEAYETLKDPDKKKKYDREIGV